MPTILAAGAFLNLPFGLNSIAASDCIGLGWTGLVLSSNPVHPILLEFPGAPRESNAKIYYK